MHHLETLIKLVSSIEGLFALAVGLLVFFLLVANRIIGALALCLPIFVSTMGHYRWLDNTLPFPLESMRAYSRPIFMLTMGMILVAAVLRVGVMQRFRIPPAAGLFLIMQLLFAVKIALSGMAPQGIFSLIVFLICFTAVNLIALENSLDARRVRLVHWTICLAGAVFCLANLYQLVTNPGSSAWAGRFIGITSNSQHAARNLALFLLPTIFLIMTNWQKLKLLLPLGGLAAAQLGLLIFTGSRTGALMFVVGVAMMFRRRIGKLAVAVVLLTLVASAILTFFPGLETAANRLDSTADTRSGKFHWLWQRFLANPVFGRIEILITSGTPRPGIGENSYLEAAASMGVIGIGLLTAWMASTFKLMRTSHRMARRSSAQGLTGHDLAIGSLTAILIGAVLEGYLLEIVGPIYILIYLYTATEWHVARQSRKVNPGFGAARQ